MKLSRLMGAICGDIVGSVYEFDPVKHKDFDLFSSLSTFTDDTVMTLAVAKSLVEVDAHNDVVAFKEALVRNMHDLGKRYPDVGYGNHFNLWLLLGKTEPYNSCGNGSAMRVSAVGWYAQSLEEAERLAKASAEVTHNHPDGIAGAVATAGAIYLARTGADKDTIRKYVAKFYDLNFTLDEIRPTYDFEPCNDRTVPQSVVAFLESESYEDAIRNTVSLGGDADTMGAITGAIAEAYYGIPEELEETAMSYLDDYLLNVCDEFLLCLERDKMDKRPFDQRLINDAKFMEFFLAEERRLYGDILSAYELYDEESIAARMRDVSYVNGIYERYLQLKEQ